MKRLVFKIAIFIGVLFILDFAIGKTLRHFYFKETSGFEYAATYSIDSTKADIVILGGSRAKYSYVPNIFKDSLKMSFYNSGSEGNAVFFQLAVLKSILKRYTPKIIILDYKESLFKGEDGYDKISLLLPYYKNHEEIREIIGLKSKFEGMKLLSQIYPFNSEIFTIAIDNMTINKERNNDEDGTFTLHGEWQYKIDTVKNRESYTIDTNKLNALKEFMSIAQKSGANVFVIYSPIYIKYNDEEQATTICKNICSADSIPFWNYSQDSAFLDDNRLFFNTYHLNEAGAIAFSKIIAHKVKDYLNRKEQ